ncbi:MAG: hypothetical protein GY861_23855 [bacterium]|nr:hypothetical protein [bacterium]
MNIFKKNRAQAATELAIFGTVLIFIIGMMIRQTMNSGYTQNFQYRAMRLAHRMSMQTAESRSSLSGTNLNYWSPARNSASVIIVEDRLSPEINKYGPLERTPYMAMGSGTFSRNLFYTTDWKEDHAVPRMDFFINGQHFIFTAGDYKEVDLTVPLPDVSSGRGSADTDTTCGTSGENCRILYRQVVADYMCSTDDDFCSTPATIDGNPTSSSIDPCPPGDLLGHNDRFDLDRDGISDVDRNDRGSFVWQWKAQEGILANVDINEKEAKFEMIDIDNDLLEETIFKVDTTGDNNRITKAYVLDFQDGDIDFATGGSDVGLQQDINVITRTENGTFLLVQEGSVVDPENGKKVRSLQRKDQVDIIQREINLTRNTGRFCDGDVRQPDVDGMVNPVMACNSCFTPENREVTCFADGAWDNGTRPTIFVRSRIEDRGGRMWLTNIEKDFE